MLSSVYSAGVCGIDGFPVTVECNQKSNLEGFELVGLPDLAVKEAKERVRTACYNSGYSFPYARITVNLAPADRKKEGSAFDAAILTSIFHSCGIIHRSVELSGKCIVGELSLSGDIRRVNGVLCTRCTRYSLHVRCCQRKRLFGVLRPCFQRRRSCRCRGNHRLRSSQYACACHAPQR